MIKKLQSLIFPIINFIVPIIFICCQAPNPDFNFNDIILEMKYTLLIGAFLGGIFTFIITIIFKIDISDCFKTRIIILGLSIIGCTLSWRDTTGIWLITIPILFEIAFSLFLIRKYSYGIMKSIVVFLSNPLLCYIGFILDFLISFSKGEFALGF